MKKQYQDIENRIDRTMKIVGDISFRGTIIVDGGITGNITGETIIVTETGEIIGDLVMEKVVCSGRITGTITAQRLSVGNAAQIKGKLTCGTLEIESGARINCEVMSNGHQPGKKKVDQFVARTADGIQEVKKRDIKQVEDTMEDEVCGEEKPATEEVAQSLPINPPVLMEQIEMSGFFPDGEREKITGSIIEAIKSSKEMVKIVGDLGSGKTTICQRVCDGLSGSFKVIRLDNVIGSSKELFSRIAEALNIQIDEDSSQMDILEKLKGNLAEKKQTSVSVVLVLDNSHEIYPATLEGVIKNLSYAYSSHGGMLQIVLFGDEHLDKHLAPKAIGYFNDHPECALELRPLFKDETRNYIGFKLGMMQRCMNSDQPVDFPDDSAAKVHTFSQGSIGKINRIVEEALELAGKKKSDKIVPKFVKNI